MTGSPTVTKHDRWTDIQLAGECKAYWNDVVIIMLCDSETGALHPSD